MDNRNPLRLSRLREPYSLKPRALSFSVSSSSRRSATKAFGDDDDHNNNNEASTPRDPKLSILQKDPHGHGRERQSPPPPPTIVRRTRSEQFRPIMTSSSSPVSPEAVVAAAAAEPSMELVLSSRVVNGDNVTSDATTTTTTARDNRPPPTPPSRTAAAAAAASGIPADNNNNEAERRRRRRMLSNPYHMFRASSSSSSQEEDVEARAASIRRAQEQKKRFLSGNHNDNDKISTTQRVPAQPIAPSSKTDAQTIDMKNKIVQATEAAKRVDDDGVYSPDNVPTTTGGNDETVSEKTHRLGSRSPTRRQSRESRNSYSRTTRNSFQHSSPSRSRMVDSGRPGGPAQASRTTARPSRDERPSSRRPYTERSSEPERLVVPNTSNRSARVAAPRRQQRSRSSSRPVPSKITMPLVGADSMEKDKIARVERRKRQDDGDRLASRARRYSIPLHDISFEEEEEEEEEDGPSETSTSGSSSDRDLSCETSQTGGTNEGTGSYSCRTDDDDDDDEITRDSDRYDTDYTDEVSGERREGRGRYRSSPPRALRSYDEPATTFGDSSTIESGSYFDHGDGPLTKTVETHRHLRLRDGGTSRDQPSWDDSEMISHTSRTLSQVENTTSYIFCRTVSAASKSLLHVTSSVSEPLSDRGDDEDLWNEIEDSRSVGSDAFVSVTGPVRRIDSQSTGDASAFITIKPDKTEKSRLMRSPSLISNALYATATYDTDIEADHAVSRYYDHGDGAGFLCGMFG